ncbi:response regulator [Lacticaseibacillus jixiensis]|uniref:response regulator n=1 Tax=Lacticaseibacillus jixiensis TaxID=3231926 RepID=UPI0036F3CEF0
MKQVLAVDDEYMILRGLPKLIAWGKLGLEISRTEQDPLAALAYLQTHRIDILLSDMNMPHLPGPEFLAAARQLQPQMQIIVLSGYDDFDYVKAGVAQSAVNYLRKPIDPDELEATVQTALQRLLQAEAYHQDARLAHQVLARELVTSHDSELAKRALVKLVPTRLQEQPLHLVAILNPLQRQALLAALDTAAGMRGYFVENRDVIVVFQGAGVRLRQFIQNLPLQAGPLHRPVIVSAAIATLDAMAEAYQRIQWAINRRYFFASVNGLVILPDDEPVPRPDTMPTIETIKHEIRHLHGQALADWLAAEFAKLEQRDASVELTRQVAMIILLSLRALHPDYALTSSNLGSINAAKTVNDLILVLLDAAEAMQQAGQQRYSRSVAAVMQIIHERYDQPMTLGEIAAQLHLSAVYLGQQFKKETGQTVAQFLNDYRINQAIHLLEESNDDVNEIGQRVGYQTVSYFFKTFKKQLNMSPGEYRDVVMKQR